MSIQERLFAWRRAGMSRHLDGMKQLLESLGNPQNAYPSVVIAGTNGKGSTAATLSALATARGERVGLYTSPHLVHFRERFRIGDADIEEAELSALAEDVAMAAARSGLRPTFFEAATAIAHLYFSRHKVQRAFLEVGLGGRLDATRICRQDMAVITDISLDHAEILGSEVSSIAREKWGIVREGGRVVAANPSAELLGLFEEEAHDRSVTLRLLDRDFSWQTDESGDRRLLRSFEGKMGQSLGPITKTALRGRHQVRNLALALEADAWLHEKETIPSNAFLPQAVQATRWSGRFQCLRRDPPVYVDGAHNKAGMEALVETVRSELGPIEGLVLSLAVKRDKPLSDLLRPWACLTMPNISIIATSLETETDIGPEAFYSPEEIVAEAGRVFGFSAVTAVARRDPRVALNEAMAHATATEPLLICGSLYWVGFALREFPHA